MSYLDSIPIRRRPVHIAACLLLLVALAAPSAYGKTAEQWQADADSFYKSKKYGECIQACTQILKLNPDNTKALNRRALARYEVKDHQGTIEDWSRYIALRGSSAPIHAFYNRGLAHRALGDHRQAFIDFNKAAQMQEDYLFCVYNRGRCRHALGDYEGAFDDYQRALKMKPGHKEILAKVDELERDVAAGKGMTTSPALRELMGAKISVFDLYLDDMRAAGRTAFGLDIDPFHPILESIDYDADRDAVIFLFTLEPSGDYAKMFDSAAIDWKKGFIEKELNSLATIAGVAPIEELGETFGLIQATPFRGVSEISDGATLRVKNEIAGKTAIAAQVQSGGKTYFASRDPKGRVTMKEAK